MDEASTNGSGRDPVTGYFRPGHKFSKGNAVARRTRELRQTILDAVTPDQVKAVVAKLAELAAEGDVPAARVFLEYTCGKPAQSVELSGPDGGPLGLDVQAITGVVLGALADHPEARFRVAQALRKAAHADDGGPDQLD